MTKTPRPILEIYEEEAQFWARQRTKGSSPELKFIEKICEQLKPKDEVLDLGCGSGYPIADFFLTKQFQVTGVDGAHAMIAIAQTKYPQATWIHAEMTQLDLNKKFSVIIAWDSFFHLTMSKQEQMFPIFKKHLRAQGYLLFTSGPKEGETIGDMNGQALYHASLSPEQYRRLLKDNGFTIEEFVSEDPTCGGHTIWLCRLNH